MAKTMKAAVVRAFGKPLTLEELPIPTPGPGEVLIKVAADGVCHTDLHAADGDWPVKPKLPFVPGQKERASPVRSHATPTGSLPDVGDGGTDCRDDGTIRRAPHRAGTPATGGSSSSALESAAALATRRRRPRPLGHTSQPAGCAARRRLGEAPDSFRTGAASRTEG
jgi:hypothetical protein